MSDAASTLGALGSDLAFSVSFGIARELLDAAEELGISEDELVSMVLALSVCFTALPRTASIVNRELRSHGVWLFRSKDGKPTELSGLQAFASVLVDVFKRISISIAVQILSSNVRAQQPVRAVRIVSLLSVALFFLFLQSLSSVGLKVAAAPAA